jgi:YggT family protein
VFLFALIFTIVYYAFFLYTAVMWIRLALDLARSFVPNWRPRGAVLIVAEFAFAITDPPIKFVRRVIKPIRFGGIALDLSWSIVLIAIFILMYIVQALAML